MPLKEFWKITIVIPVNENAETSLPLLPSEAMKNCDALRPMIEFLKASDPIGRTGNHIGVYGLVLRSGGYTPTKEADPIKGEAGKGEEGLCYDLITYADRSLTPDELSRFSDEVQKIHPWEHPTIEISEIKIWMP